MLHTIQSVKEGNQVLIVCMGDSITEQNSHCHQHLNYVGLFAEQLLQTFGRRTFVFNTGLSGEMTGQAIERLHLDALRHKPDLLTLMYGINDSKKRTGRRR
jgi:lysophospholipase L1-like esterase